jgi:hypothetical protein
MRCHPALPHDEIALRGLAAFQLTSARWMRLLQLLEPLRMLPRGTVHCEERADFAWHLISLDDEVSITVSRLQWKRPRLEGVPY